MTIELQKENAALRARLAALEPLLYEVDRRAGKMGIGEADEPDQPFFDFTVTIDGDMWDSIKDAL